MLINSPKRAIIYVGASKPQVPGIKAAKRAGLYTIATDISEAAEGAKYADVHARISATDTEGLLKLAHEINQKYVLVGCYGVADYAYGAIGVINEEFGLAGGTCEVYARASNKDVSKKMWQKYGLPTANAISVTENDSVSKIQDRVNRELSLPVVVKPINSYNSRGITVLESLNEFELKASIERGFQESQQVMIEKFLEGTHVNVDVLMLEGEYFPVSCTERSFYSAPGSSSSWGLQPPDISEATEAKLYQLTAEAARCLGLTTGPVTADTILSHGKPVLLEISPHYHSLFTNAIRDGGASIEAWFRYLSGSQIRTSGFISNWDHAAYINLIGTKRQIEELMDVISCKATIVDFDDRYLKCKQYVKIAWLKGKSNFPLKSLLLILERNLLEIALD